jgi:transcriptional regulator with XRE-family HTH domain
MEKQQSELVYLSETAEDLGDFLKKACALLKISYRQVSLQAGFSHAAVWNLASGHIKRGNDNTIAKLALFFKVPEVNLRTLAGFGPQRISPTYGLGRAEAIFQLLTDEEKDKWIEYGELLIKARRAEFHSTGEK